MEQAYDVVIIGGGIGGGALATVLARAGKSTLVLEKSTVYRDRVRGEWMAPWGVAEARRLGLYDALIAAGGHHLTTHRTYGDHIEPAEAEAAQLDMSALVADVAGPLCLGHPKHCETLEQTARAAGATVLRGAGVPEITLGRAPSVRYEHEGAAHVARARIVVGADGRGSMVRQAAGIALHRNPTHHFMGGMLIEGAHGWDDRLQAIASEGEGHYLAFPQGGGRIRLYLGFPKDDPSRYAGAGGPRAFLDAFHIASLPGSEHIANATPAGPCSAYPNEDAWTGEPCADGAVLVGDSAGWNDPIIGQGLSITYRDVRLVGEIMLACDDWSPAAFAPYGVERAERMRRLRFSAALQSAIENEFGEEARARRRRVHERRRADPTFILPALATMVGPDAVPALAFEETLRERLLA